MNNDVDSGGASTAVVEETLPKLADMSEQDRSAYLKDGTLPKTEQKPTSDDGAKPVESGAASDAANKDQGQDKDEEPKRESRAERRIRKLNDEIKQLRAEKAKAETKPPIESRPVADAAKPAATTSTAPKLKAFTDKIGAKDGYADWDAAHDAYETARDLYQEEARKTAVAEALKAERDKSDADKQKELEGKTATSNANKYASKALEFRKTLPQDDFAEMFVAVKEDLDEAIKARKEISIISAVLVAPETHPGVIYYLGKNPEELDKLLEMPVERALIELGKLEVSDKIKTPTPKTITAARKRATDVSGAHVNAEDPVEAAAEKNDIVSFIKEQNKREGVKPDLRWGH